MQPLYSVDHERRQNSHRNDDYSPPSEDTPLLTRFPQNSVERSPLMFVAISLLFLILVAGIVIGIYLLILQTNSENILPPVDAPLELFSRKQFRKPKTNKPTPSAPLDGPTGMVKQVIVVQTDTEPCSNTFSCVIMLQSWQLDSSSGEKMLPYNFMVASNGQTYETLGWLHASPMFPQYQNTLVLAFIGNFTSTPPTELQVAGVKNFFAESVSQKRLDPAFIVFGKKTSYKPKYLFKSLQSLPQWRQDLTD